MLLDFSKCLPNAGLLKAMSLGHGLGRGLTGRTSQPFVQ